MVALAKDKKKRPVTPAMLTKALEASKEKRNRMPLQTKVLPNLLTPGGAELGDLTRFVESWNSVDCPGSSSLSANLLKGVEDSVHALQDQLEVNFPPLMFILRNTFPSPRDSGRVADAPRSKEATRLESSKLDKHEPKLETRAVPESVFTDNPDDLNARLGQSPSPRVHFSLFHCR